MTRTKQTKRQQIIEENLMQYKNSIVFSERNIKIVEEVVAGDKYNIVAEHHNISMTRVQQIVTAYIMHCHFYLDGVNIYKEKFCKPI